MKPLGGFDTRLRVCMEDWEFYVRAALYCQFIYSPEILATSKKVLPENSSQQAMP